jgi:stage II sporulation protein D
MKRIILLILCVQLLPQFSFPQSSNERSDLTVRLFSTHTVTEATFVPLGSGGRMRLCAQCKETAITSPLTLKLTKDGISISPSSPTTPRKQIYISGAFRIRVDGVQAVETAAGQWSINATPDGMRVLLTTSVERYVIAALNGEAAPDEPVESLKAMAVTARTFALANPRRHAKDGFDLCDSTHCQALRFGMTRPEIEQAVRVTAGGTLWSGARRAETYATQHCGGQAEDASNIWPSLHAAYLRGHPDPYCLRKSAAQWHADIDVAQLTRVLREQHWNLPAQIDEVQIVKRTPSGRVQMLDIIGEDKRVSVSASSLRFALNRSLGWNQLRSDWYDVVLNHGVIRFDGKGYGHGVGLCQAGALRWPRKDMTIETFSTFTLPERRCGLRRETAAGKT